ncbi:hypothetical protein AMTRI_Chr12g272140 [Amborella trichopoda]
MHALGVSLILLTFLFLLVASIEGSDQKVRYPSRISKPFIQLVSFIYNVVEDWSQAIEEGFYQCVLFI